uniref:Uncharacterized protein n=1 Tax=Anguilla anguilla TaxID=7936 RepID=A0A0E9W3L6_ANGAN
MCRCRISPFIKRFCYTFWFHHADITVSFLYNPIISGHHNVSNRWLHRFRITQVCLIASVVQVLESFQYLVLILGL